MYQLPHTPSRRANSLPLPHWNTRDLETGSPPERRPRPRFQFWRLLGHCLYRRVILWTSAGIFTLAILFFFQSNTSNKLLRAMALVENDESTPMSPQNLIQHPILSSEIPEVAYKNEEMSEESSNDVFQQDQVPVGAYEQMVAPAIGEMPLVESPPPRQEQISGSPKWMRYKYLDGYYNGLRSLVPMSQYIPENPKSLTGPDSSQVLPHTSQLSKPTPYHIRPEYDTEEYRRSYVPVEPCYLDAAKTVATPNLYAYNGLPQNQPKASIGSHKLFGISDDVCFDRFGRYGAYGLGYGIDEGGTGEGLDTENEGSETVWESTGKIDYRNVDWADAQERCVASNEDRFYSGNKFADASGGGNHLKKIDRMAVVVRTFQGFKWTSHVVMNFRAMITELNLKSGGEYDVHFLLHVHDTNAPIWADPSTAQEILDANVPREFHGICTLWSEAQMQLFYPGNYGDAFENPSMSDIHGVYRSAHMPLQHFSIMHPEYAHIWNWEMDMRYTGSYGEVFDKIGKWAASQSRKGIWERSSRYYIPEYHGNWENFTEMVEKETAKSGKKPIMGPVMFAGKSNLISNGNFMPSSCDYNTDSWLCGVGEEADLIALNPLFDAKESGWVFSEDVTGYDRQYDTPPRRSSIVTASRISRRLLSVMHEETWRLHHSMFTEMFPAAMAFHHGLKAVYAPHPVLLDHDWPSEEIDSAFNGGEDHTAGGRGSPFNLANEHNHKGSTWYYNSQFSSLLWNRWLGYAQWDGRGDNGGTPGLGVMRGGREEEEDPATSGRLCLRPILFHPIKHESPSESGY